ncbi:MAG: pyridinium-3,5-bisthiocarboxylic acid mononucleotide nickel chelatase, partial [Candidatus Hydrogenedentes bacterium]|nr:pyridinium-3,5-bisthiocarboxylic acid mononucleotide nickel chelatase [Candidatus Hydrogenedentota bacterium]
MKSLYLDCFCGASGDMIAGALIDAGAPFETIQRALASLGVEGLRVSAEKVHKHGIAATQFRVHLDHGHDHVHRHLSHVLDILGRGDLP